MLPAPRAPPFPAASLHTGRRLPGQAPAGVGRRAVVACSVSAAWLPEPEHGSAGRDGGGCGRSSAWQQPGLGQLSFRLHHEFDEDLDEEPEPEPHMVFAPTAPPLRRAAITVRDRLRQLSATSRRLLAGGWSAAVSKTATAPLSTIQMQLVQGRLGAWAAAENVLRDYGPMGFFRGNAVDVVRTVPAKALELAAYDALKRALRGWRWGKGGRQVLPDSLMGGLSGGLAGILSTVVTYPMETVRTRMAVAARPGGAHYRSVADCVARMTAQEGPSSLFKGLNVSLAGVIPYAALRLGIYDALKWSHKKATNQHHIDPAAAFLFGAIAGVASSTATYPFEVARRRMMMGAAYPSVAAALAGILRQEGVGALYNGVLLSAAKQAPQYALGFMSYEQCKRWLDL